jgi:hypothetical protein
MHNGQTADPLNKYAKAIKQISGKRKKTEADFEEMARIEYIAGLYMNADGPVISNRLLEAAITEGARKSKLGKLAQAGVVVEKHARLNYNGPRDVDGLLSNDEFRLAVPVKIGQQKIVRTRPIFPEWSANIEVCYLADIINERDLLTAVRNAGALCGLGDWRPRYGRFALRMDLTDSLAAD